MSQITVFKNVATVFIGNIKQYNHKITNRIVRSSQRYEEKFKNTIVGNWIRYWKILYADYRDVAVEIRRQSKEKPLKMLGFLSTFGVLWSFAKTNPDDVSFRDSLLIATNDLILVNPSMQKPSAAEHLRLLEKCYNRSIIRRQSFIFFSVMWLDNFSCDCNKFECQCPYLEVSYLQFFKRIIDIGFVNKWWLLEKHIEDYDVNL